MHIRRISAVALALLITAGALQSCGGEKPETAAATAAAVTEPEQTETAEPRIDPGLPDIDLGGYKITFYGKKVTGVYAESLTGEIVNDAVYNRNIALNEKYNFEIVQITPENQTDPTTEIKNIVMAGEDAYQVLVDGGNRFVPYIQSGLLYDMNTLSHQDYSKPWWFDNMNKGLSLDGKLFMSASAFMLSPMQGIYHPFINADLAENYGVRIEDLYQTVRDDKWTVDKLIDIIKLGGADLDGNGVMDQNDQWGLTTEAYCGYVMAIGCGYQIAKKDENDEPYLTVVSEESNEIWDRLCSQVFSDGSIFLATQNIKGADNIWTTSSNIMAEGRSLVFYGGLGDGLRSYEYNFGVLPSPKFKESQEYYYHTGSSWNNPLIAVPVTAADPDKVSLILEAMSYYSYYDVLPSFYQDFMERKLVRDEGSIEMLHIINSSIFYDPGAVYNWGGCLNILYEIVKSGVNNSATAFAKVEKSASKEIDKLMSAVRG